MKVSKNELKRFLNIAQKISYEVGEWLKKNQKNKQKIEYKGGSQLNLVTKADKKADEMILKMLKKELPSHYVVSEETENERTENDGFVWYVDPLDGTTNYAHGFPFYCVSLALLIDGEIKIGVVYCPRLNEIFECIKGEGAYLNKKRIRVSDTKEVGKSLLATGFPYDLREDPDEVIGNFIKFCLKARGIRRAGSAALDLCYLAAGIFDGFWEVKLHPWDIAAGILMIREAGGIVTDFQNNDTDIFSKHILASNGKIHKQLVKIINVK